MESTGIRAMLKCSRQRKPVEWWQGDGRETRASKHAWDGVVPRHEITSAVPTVQPESSGSLSLSGDSVMMCVRFECEPGRLRGTSSVVGLIEGPSVGVLEWMVKVKRWGVEETSVVNKEKRDCLVQRLIRALAIDQVSG